MMVAGWTATCPRVVFRGWLVRHLDREKATNMAWGRAQSQRLQVWDLYETEFGSTFTQLGLLSQFCVKG
jgi:hypothetical protein